jgi:hypothetical protein
VQSGHASLSCLLLVCTTTAAPCNRTQQQHWIRTSRLVVGWWVVTWVAGRGQRGPLLGQAGAGPGRPCRRPPSVLGHSGLCAARHQHRQPQQQHHCRHQQQGWQASAGAGPLPTSTWRDQHPRQQRWLVLQQVVGHAQCLQPQQQVQPWAGSSVQAGACWQLPAERRTSSRRQVCSRLLQVATAW